MGGFGSMMGRASGCDPSIATISGLMTLCITGQTMAFDHCPRTNGEQGLIIQDAQYSGRTQPRMPRDPGEMKAQLD
jgi:hypothetical protein